MDVPVIKFVPLYHRGEERIGIVFPINKVLQPAVKKLAGVRWSKTHSCWHIPCTEKYYKQAAAALNKFAAIDNKELSAYLRTRKSGTGKAPLPTGNLNNIPVQKDAIKAKDPSVFFPVSVYNTNLLMRTTEHLQMKAYSVSTIRTYRNEIGAFFQTLKNKKADELTGNDVRRYIHYCTDTLHLSENTVHSRLNALKYMYEQVLGREKIFADIPRPKKPLLLPKLLNEKEITALFNALTNKKHKAMLFTAYSAGLRVSEVVNLRLRDIDSGRMQILVARAKGKKDRYVNLSPVLLDILRKYISEYRPKPKEYLFESEQTLTAYPIRTMQQIFSNAKQKAGIKKEVGIHSLRHSFATHLLDKGTDIRYIKDLLGHFNIKTTEIYLHVSKQNLVNITSPFDDLWKKEGIDW